MSKGVGVVGFNVIRGGGEMGGGRRREEACLLMW